MAIQLLPLVTTVDKKIFAAQQKPLEEFLVQALVHHLYTPVYTMTTRPHRQRHACLLPFVGVFGVGDSCDGVMMHV